VRKLAWQARDDTKEQLSKVDPSTLKALPKQREPGWSIKKPESQGIPKAKTPAVGAPDARAAKPSLPSPAERQAAERRGKPPPEEQEQQKEKERLQERLASSLSEIVEDKSDERFSEKWLLRQQLSPYLDEYPFLAEDIPTLTKLRDFLNTPQAPAINYAFGVFDAWNPDSDQQADLQIRQIISEAMLKRPDSPDIA
jgi:hypothetical protein